MPKWTEKKEAYDMAELANKQELSKWKREQEEEARIEEFYSMGAPKMPIEFLNECKSKRINPYSVACLEGQEKRLGIKWQCVDRSGKYKPWGQDDLS